MPTQKLHRLSPVLRNNEALGSLREIEENPIGCQASAGLRICISEGNSKVCGQGYSYHESHPTGHVALQSPPTTNELCSPSNYIQVEISTKYETVVTLTPTSKRNLQWWVELKKAPLGAPVQSRLNNNDTIGCIQQGLGYSVEWLITDGGLWSPEEATHHINYLELLATFLAIKAFGKAWPNVTVLLRMDNVTTVSHINQKGRTVSQLLCQLVLTIWTWCVERNTSLLAEHLSGQAT